MSQRRVEFPPYTFPFSSGHDALLALYARGLRLRRRLLTGVLAPARAILLDGRRERFAQRRAGVSSGSEAIARSLDEHGVVTLSAPRFLDLLDAERRTVLAGLAGRVSHPDFWRGTTTLEGDGLLELDPAIWRLGLAPVLLDAAETYFGLPCFYLGAALKHERADGRATGARQWHLDIEDERMLRLIVYLREVAPGGGPFEHLDAQTSAEWVRGANYRSGYVTDQNMGLAGRAGRPVYGEACQAIFFDGVRVVHRAQPPRAADRYSVTFTYVTRWPLQLNLTAQLSPSWRKRMAAELGERERGCLPPPRRL